MIITPIDSLRGKIASSPSKSFSHRAFAIALGASSPSYIVNPLTEGDVGVTIGFLQAFGANISEIHSGDVVASHSPNPIFLSESDRAYLVEPPVTKKAPGMLDGKNSGTSIRMMAALAGVFGDSVSISGEFFKRGRPMGALLDALAQIGIDGQVDSTENTLKIIPKDPKAGPISIPGDISSQFITGLLLLSPHLREGEHTNYTTITLTTPVKSYPYLKITEQILHEFGIKVTANFDQQLQGYYKIPAEQSYRGRVYRVPGDFSSAAFVIVAAALNPLPYPTVLRNLDVSSPQGDKAILDIIKLMGADVQLNPTDGSITITGGQFLRGIDIDCSQTPDLFPILCVLGLFATDITRLYNAKHVRLKETDRIAVMVRELRKMGAIIQENDDGVSIDGPQSLKGITVQHDDDHRIAMALVIAALYARNPSRLPDPDIVKDSYPAFYSDLRQLGCKFQDE